MKAIRRSHSVVLFAALGLATLAVALLVYLACIHLLGFPDGYVSPPHRIRRLLAWMFVVVSAMAALYYFACLLRPMRRVKTVMVLQGASAVVLLVLIAYHSRSMSHIG
jgi:hypothetical protein